LAIFSVIAGSVYPNVQEPPAFAGRQAMGAAEARGQTPNR
jgi:hypothetical protein